MKTVQTIFSIVAFYLKEQARACAIFAPFFLVANCVFAQAPTQVLNLTGSKYVYVGTLSMDASNTSNSQKIVVKILGGSWFQTSNAETTYFISNRDGLNIRQVSLGGSAKGYISLKAYQNGTNTNIYLVPNSTEYASFSVSSYSYGFNLMPQYFAITSQTTLPAGTDVTSSVPVIPSFITDAQGNIGIGTETPLEALSVNGKIRSKEVKVENTNWPDYVFSKDYKLPSLAQIDKYIQDKGHLMGIPSAKEVYQNGLSIGEFQSKLLEKIEELTLLLIEKDRELTFQKTITKDHEDRLRKLEQKNPQTPNKL